MNLDAMYQEIILDHYKNPHGRGLREPFDGESYQVNPTCGDELQLRVRLDGEQVADGRGDLLQARGARAQPGVAQGGQTGRDGGSAPDGAAPRNRPGAARSERV